MLILLTHHAAEACRFQSAFEASYLHILGTIRCDDSVFIQHFFGNGVPATIYDNERLSALSLALAQEAFSLARILIDGGASVFKEGAFGVTPLGELLIPSQADQCGNLFPTFEFLLSYRGHGVQVFITRLQLKCTVFHIAAAYYCHHESYSKMADAIFKYFPDQDSLGRSIRKYSREICTAESVAQYITNIRKSYFLPL